MIDEWICKEVETTQALIENIQEQNWLAEWTRDNTMIFTKDNKCVVLRLYRLDDYFSITLVEQTCSSLEYQDWEDGDWHTYIDGDIKDIERLITLEVFEDMKKQIRNLLK